MAQLAYFYGHEQFPARGAPRPRRSADGLILSMKAPAEASDQVIDPFRRAAREAGRREPTIVAQRWSIRAADEDEAWQALQAWTPGELAEIHWPRVEVGADVVTIQVTSVDQTATIRQLGAEVLAALRALRGRETVDAR